MKLWSFIASLFLCLVAKTGLAAMPTFYIKDGVLDLSQWNPETTPLFKVSGEAEFYWQQFIMTDGADPLNRKLIEFPGAWNMKADYPYHGYTSVRFHVILPAIRDFGVQWSWVWTAMEAYADGRLIYKNGRLGRDVDSAIPGKVIGWMTHIIPSHREFDIVIQISNFDLFLGGHVDTIVMGTHAAVVDMHQKKLAVDTFL